MTTIAEKDALILEAIRSFQGIPTPHALAGPTGYREDLISSRLEANPVLAHAQEERSFAYVEGLTTEELKTQTAKKSGLVRISAGNPGLLARIYERIDHEIILPEIQNIHGISNSNVLAEPTGYGIHFILSRFEANPALVKAHEQRNIAYIDSLTLEEIKIQTAIQGGLMLKCKDCPELLARLYERIDQEILFPGVQNFQGIPTSRAVERITGFSNSYISRRLQMNPALARAQEERGLTYINGLTKEEFKEQAAKIGGLLTICSDYPNLLARLYERIDEEILLPGIRDFHGFSTPSSLAEPTGFGSTLISHRIQANPVLAHVHKERNLAYIDSLTVEELKEQTATHGGLLQISKEHPEPFARLYERIDKEILLPEIRASKGIPSTNALVESTGYSDSFIASRFAANPALSGAQKERGLAYINGLTIEELKEQTAKKTGLTAVCGDRPELIARLYERTDQEILLPGIQNFQGIPTARSLAMPTGYSNNFIASRLRANPALAQAQKERSFAYVNSLTTEDLKRQTAKTAGLNVLCMDHPELGARIYERIDIEILLPTIRNFQGIPTPNALADPTGYSSSTIILHLLANPALTQAQEACGLAYIDSLTTDELKKRTAKVNGLSSECKDYPELLARLYERIDQEILLPEIQKLHGIPFQGDLAKPTGYSKGFISRRLQANPVLFLAMAAKQGLTPDQAVELALERNDESRAAKRALAQRLQNLHAFREMVGLLLAIGHLFTQRRILEVTLYPNPLIEAAQELGLFLPIGHRPMQDFRKGKKPDLPKAETIVLQGIHRLAGEGLTSLFQQVHKSLTGTVIATYSIRHAPTEGFMDALIANGFEVTEQGILRIDPPSDKELLGAGVAIDELGRAREKLSGSSNVLILSRNADSQNTPIPALVKIPTQENGREFEPADMVPLTIPAGLANQLKASFLPNISTLPSSPFLIELVTDKPVALIGFDMHPKQLNSLEVSTYPGAPEEDYHGFARRLANSATLRKNMGIQPGQIKRLPLNRIRSSW